MTDGEVLCLISKWLNDTYQHGMLLTGIILLQPVDGIRAYGSEVGRTRLFRQICGQDAFGNVLIGTTMWSKLKDRNDSLKRVEQRKKSGDFWANLVSKGARLEEHQDTTESAHRIIRMLMDKSKKPLQLQEELARAGGRVSGTSTAKQLYEDISMVSSEKQEKLDKIFEEMRSIRKNNEEYQAEIAELKNRIANLKYQKELIKTETVSYPFPKTLSSITVN
jgi:DNA repair exonuclease SbcCD ATPase subunit